MKRKYFYLMALAALTLGGCSTENDLFGDDPNGGPEGPKQQVTFLFPGTAQGVVPYAIASEDENKVETLDIYVFGADKLDTTDPAYLLEDVVKLEAAALGQVQEALTATISFVGTNAKKFYFVANGRSQTALDDYELNVTTITDFTKKKTLLTGKSLLKAPLLMTGYYAITVGEDGTITPAGPHNIELIRRVARFDIKNDSEESTLQIEKILIKSARQGAYIFADADAAADLVADDDFPAYDGPTIAALMEIDFQAFNDANMGETGSVFYLYPSLAIDKTSFELRGRSTQSNEMMVQPVKMQKAQKDDDKTPDVDESALLPILPNHRYSISVLAAGMATVTANITVEEWKVGEQVEVEAGFGFVKLALTDAEAGTAAGIALTESKTLTVPSTVLAPFGINVTADTEWEIANPTAIPWIAVTNAPVAGAVGKSFTLEITEANPSSEARNGILYIRNVKRPSVVQALTVVQAGDALTGFKIEGDKFENNTLLFFGSADAAILTLTLPGAVDAFDTEISTEDDVWINLEAAPVTREFTSVAGKKLKVSVVPNDGQTERTGSFNIKVGQVVQTITVKQASKNLGGISVTAIGMLNNTVIYSAAEQTTPYLVVKALTEWGAKAFDMNEDVVSETESEWITNGTTVFTSTTDPKINYNGKYTFTLTANTEFTERKSRIIVANTVDANIKSEITIIQSGKLETLSLAGSGYADPVLTLAADAATALELTVTSDKPSGTLTALTATEAADWLEVAVSGEGNAQKVTVTPTANTETTAREAVVTVKMEGATDKVFTVKQAGKVVEAPTFTVTGVTNDAIAYESAEVSATEYTVVPSNHTFTGLTVVKQEVGADWLTYAQTTLETDGKFTLAATANDTGAARSATVTITLPGAAASMVITVTQAAAVAPVAPVLSISDGTNNNITGYAFAVDAAVDALATFTATATEGVTSGFSVAMEANEWLTLDDTNVSTTGVFTITCTGGDNSAGTARSATVTVKVAGAEDKTFTVTQPGA